MYLQQVMPGKFSVVECNDPDFSPTGHLPYLVHEHHTVTSLGSIIKYITGLKATGPTRSSSNLDSSLSGTEKAQSIAWCAHVESNLGDIVSYALYSNQDNWAELMHPALASLYPIPQRYYIPGRIREMYRPRLESAGLWDLPIKEEEKKPFKIDKSWQKRQNTKLFQETFGRERVCTNQVLEKARISLEIYARLLDEHDFIYRDRLRPTTLDIVLAAHILLLLKPEYPEPSIQNLIKHTHPALASHARRVFEHISSCPESQLRISSTPKFVWSSLIPWPSTAWKDGLSEEDIHFRRMRWGFYGLTLGSMAVYLAVSFQNVSRHLWK
ncbi:Metaxin-1 [Termitomyces sp. J132]|nr:Metaxin-1 [Termitomyces sp. J132]